MQIIDSDMPYEQFLAIFEGVHAEWIDGVVYQLPNRSVAHQTILQTLDRLFTCYLKKYPIGQHLIAPAILRVNSVSSARCPDIQVLVGDNTQIKHGHEVNGPADVVIEIISEHHHTYERGDKFIEYERAGVGEYWIIDPIREECLIYRLDAQYFQRVDPSQDGTYHSQRLSHFQLPLNLLWSAPSDAKIQQLVDSM